MSNIVFSDEDVKRLGGYRWDEKNPKEYVIQYAIIAAFGVLGVVAIENIRQLASGYPRECFDVRQCLYLHPKRNNQTQKAVCRTVSQGCQELTHGLFIDSR